MSYKLIELAAKGTAADGTGAQDPVLVTGEVPFARGFSGKVTVLMVGATGAPVIKAQATTAEDPEDEEAVWTDLFASSGVLAQTQLGAVDLPEGCTGVRANVTTAAGAGDYSMYLELFD